MTSISLREKIGTLVATLYHGVNHSKNNTYKDTILKLNKMTSTKLIKKRIGKLVATLYTGVTVHEDSMYGSDAPLILTINGEVVAADCYEADDYKEWVPFLMTDFAL